MECNKRYRDKSRLAVDAAQMTDLILYAYQGIRMWSRVIPLEKKTIRNIIKKIETDLTGGTE